MRGVSGRSKAAESAEPGHDRAGVGADDAAMAGFLVCVAGMVLTAGACRLYGRAPVPGHRRRRGRRCRCTSSPRARVPTDVRRYRALGAGDGGAVAGGQGRIDSERVRASAARRPERLERQPGSGACRPRAGGTQQNRVRNQTSTTTQQLHRTRQKSPYVLPAKAERVQQETAPPG